MASQASVDDFLAQRTLAIAGVSRSGKGFGNVVLKRDTGPGCVELGEPRATSARSGEFTPPVIPFIDPLAGDRRVASGGCQGC